MIIVKENFTFKIVNNFGNWLKKWRVEAGLSLRQLETRIHKVCTFGYLGQLEKGITGKKGQTFMPDIEIVEALAKALHRPVDEARAAAGYSSKGINVNDLTRGNYFLTLAEKFSDLNDEDQKEIWYLVDLLDREIEKKINHPDWKPRKTPEIPMWKEPKDPIGNLSINWAAERLMDKTFQDARESATLILQSVVEEAAFRNAAALNIPKEERRKIDFSGYSFEQLSEIFDALQLQYTKIEKQSAELSREEIQKQLFPQKADIVKFEPPNISQNPEPYKDIEDDRGALDDEEKPKPRRKRQA